MEFEEATRQECCRASEGLNTELLLACVEDRGQPEDLSLVWDEDEETCTKFFKFEIKYFADDDKVEEILTTEISNQSTSDWFIQYFIFEKDNNYVFFKMSVIKK